MSSTDKLVRELCFLLVSRQTPTGRDVLLGRKQRGFGSGRVVVPGGKVDDGETPRQAAARELTEETSLVVNADSLIDLGMISYTFESGSTPDLIAHVFAVDDPSGTASDSDEIAVLWVPEHDVPFASMWADARVWMPQALEHRTVAGLSFSYAADGSTLLAPTPV